MLGHKFMTDVAWLWNLYGYFAANDKMFNIHGAKNWSDQVILYRHDFLKWFA